MRFLLLLSLFISGCGTCKGVLGVAYEKETGIVDHVATNSPAEKIGLQKGDYLVEPKQSIKGDPGNDVVITFKRENETHVKKTQLVCANTFTGLGW